MWMSISINWIESEKGKWRHRVTGSVCCAFLWEVRDMNRFRGHKEKVKTEGKGEDTGKRRLADRPQSMRSGEGAKNVIGLLD